jgi:hypothetical protein
LFSRGSLVFSDPRTDRQFDAQEFADSFGALTWTTMLSDGA